VRTRAILFGLLVVLSVLGCASAAIFTLTAGGLRTSQDKQLTARTDEAAAELVTAPAGAFTAAPPAAPLDPSVDNDIFTIVLAGDGTPLRWTGGVDPRLPADVLARAPINATVSIDGVATRVHVEAWHRPDLGLAGYVAAAQPIRRRQSDLDGVAAVLVIASIITIVAASGGLWLASRRLQAAHRRTEDALAGQQRFAADASHELRTPLTTVLNNASFLRAHPDARPEDRSAAIADIEAEAGRMSRLVGDLLTLARADGGATLTPATVDVGALARDVCRQAGAQHPARHIHCRAGRTILRADGDALTQLLWILIGNAARHTADGGNVWVSVTPHGPYSAIVVVADDGDGLEPGTEARIFDRFYQADPARKHGGAGLGLSIAQWITGAHRGLIRAVNNDRGGATFTAVISSIS
jgi:two-component system, OmpR family, sensor kinase